MAYRSMRTGCIAAILAASVLALDAKAAPPKAWTVVENGLRDQVSSQKTVPYRLTDRQRYYQIPAISVAVIRNGQIAWARAWGRRSIDRAAAVNTHTLFAAASMTKPMTALVALRLVDQGKLSLDQDVNERLLRWKLPFAKDVPPQSVTLRQLLSHSAGVTTYGDLGYKAGERRRDLIALLEGRMPDVSPPIEVEHDPGREMHYSNPGYVIVQKLIEDVTGESFAAVVQREVLDPLGMRESYLEQPLTAHARNVAVGSSGGAPMSADTKVATELGNGGLWSTPSDMARLLIAIRAAYTGKPGALLSQSLAKQMLTPQLGGWGLGIGVEGAGDDLRFGHTGAFAGFESIMTAYAGRGDGVVLMTNADGGQQLGGEIIRGLAARYRWTAYSGQSVKEVSVAAPQLQSLAGYYASADVRAWVSYHDGCSWLISDRGGWSRLLAVGGNRFISAANGVEISVPESETQHAPLITLRTTKGITVLARKPYFGSGEALYLRGTMNAWNTSLPLTRTREGFEREIELQPGSYQFKIASADWDAVDLGSAPASANLGRSGDVALEHWGAAISLTVAMHGRYRVAVDVAEEARPILRLKRLRR
jgi:CubicO group peptidase (beta-lactamase class C family)